MPEPGNQAALLAGSQDKPDGGTESEAGGMRTVTDEFGEVKIPAHPQRVAGIYVEDCWTVHYGSRYRPFKRDRYTRRSESIGSPAR
ncbi:hypothetical protein ABD76_19980 [Paenibacillus dendritiformis]|uniref:hypothetical protein n=1 Tax=Paenibacillus dendritiformis TaxID=130049 RepID=UPI0018CE81D5|nr:hypothetical protein [Paenibacillus dendritiformis]